jgi:hypothetical protein
MKLTRRQLTAGAAAAIAARAQTPSPPRSDNTTPQAELQNARDKVRATMQLLSQFEIPMAIEPAFSFQA